MPVWSRVGQCLENPGFTSLSSLYTSERKHKCIFTDVFFPWRLWNVTHVYTFILVKKFFVCLVFLALFPFSFNLTQAVAFSFFWVFVKLCRTVTVLVLVRNLYTYSSVIYGSDNRILKTKLTYQINLKWA